MTGLALRRAISTARFCTSGTSSSGSSTPRSPRATMTPSKASMISSRLSTACGFSILAMTGSAHALLVHDLVDVVDVVGRAHERQRDHVGAQAQGPAQVLLVLLATCAGTLTATPGRLRPLLLLTGPPTSTTVSVTSVPVDRGRRAGRTLPSSIRMRVARPRRRRAGPCRSCEHDLAVARRRRGGDRERRARRRARPGRRRTAEPDLGALQVDEDADGVAGLVGRPRGPRR